MFWLPDSTIRRTAEAKPWSYFQPFQPFSLSFLQLLRWLAPSIRCRRDALRIRPAFRAWAMDMWAFSGIWWCLVLSRSSFQAVPLCVDVIWFFPILSQAILYRLPAQVCVLSPESLRLAYASRDPPGCVEVACTADQSGQVCFWKVGKS